MTIGFNTLFAQRDVRITPTSTATATAVGLTTPLYVTLATHADLVNERVLTAGEGIDFTDNGAGGTLVVTGEDATTANKGIASFDASDFDVAAGVVTIDDSGVDHAAITNTHNMTTDIDARITAGEGIDYAAGTISGEDATTANKGIANFDVAHFVVTAGEAALNNTVVNAINANTAHAAADGSDHSLLANKTSYLSIPGVAFKGFNPDTSDIGYIGTVGAVTAQANAITLLAPVNLPHGAVVTAAVVYGDAAATAETWVLYREEVNAEAAGETMATANIGTADSTITGATVDNSAYRYFLQTSSIDTDDTIFGAVITYTTDYV